MRAPRPGSRKPVPGNRPAPGTSGFGDLAAVWGILDRLGVVEIVDAVVGPRRSDAAASVGTYLALATVVQTERFGRLSAYDTRATALGPTAE